MMIMMTKSKTTMTITMMKKMKTTATMTITYVFLFIELGKFQLWEEKVQDENQLHSNIQHSNNYSVQEENYNDVGDNECQTRSDTTNYVYYFIEHGKFQL